MSGEERDLCVCVLFFLSSTQWSFQRTSLKRHSYSLCVKGVSVGRVCWCRQAGWWLTKVIRLWNLAGEWGGVSSAPSRRAPQWQGRLEAPRLPPHPPPPPEHQPPPRLSCVLPLPVRQLGPVSWRCNAVFLEWTITFVIHGTGEPTLGDGCRRSAQGKKVLPWAVQGDCSNTIWGTGHAGEGEMCSGDADFSSITQGGRGKRGGGGEKKPGVLEMKLR